MPEDIVIPCDLTRDDGRAAIIEQTAARWNRVDVLINNAGRGSYFSPLTSPLDDARSMFDSGFLRALSDLAQLAAPWLKTKGTIVNVSSIASQISLAPGCRFIPPVTCPGIHHFHANNGAPASREST